MTCAPPGHAPVRQTAVLRLINKRHGLVVTSNGAKKEQIRWNIFPIVDNLRMHHSKPVKPWLAEDRVQIEVENLPTYSPDLNPDEMANADL